MSLDEYLYLVAIHLADVEISDEYERRLAAYYFGNGIPAVTAAKQILQIRAEGAR